MKHLALYSLCFVGLLQAQDLDGYLSDLKQKEFSYDYDKTLLEKQKLRDSWIQPLQLR